MISYNNLHLFSAQDQTDLSDMDDFSGSNNLLSVFLEYCSVIQQFSKSKTFLSCFLLIEL